VIEQEAQVVPMFIVNLDRSNFGQLHEQLFQIKFVAKSFAKSSKKALKEEQLEKKKIKKAIEQNNIEGARIYAQNAIRKKNDSLNYLKLSSRLDAVASRMDTAIKMNMITKSMKKCN